MFELKKVGMHWLIRPTGGQFGQLDIPFGAKHVEITDNFLVIDKQVYEIKTIGNIVCVEKLPVISLAAEKHEPRCETKDAMDIKPVTSSVGLRRRPDEKQFDDVENTGELFLPSSKTITRSKIVETEYNASVHQRLKKKGRLVKLTNEESLSTSEPTTQACALNFTLSQNLKNQKKNISLAAESEINADEKISAMMEDGQTEYYSLDVSHTEESSEIETNQETKKEKSIRFVLELANSEILEGKDVTLKCQLSKSAPVTWTKDGSPLEESEHAVLQTEDTSHQLHIPKVRMEDAGTYAVHVGKLSSSCTLNVKEKPIRFVLGLKNIEILEGKDVTLKCQLSKSAPVTWTKDDSPLEESEHAVLQTEDTSHQLYIPEVKMEDAGTYAVHKGKLSSSCRLIVKEKPVIFVLKLADSEILEGKDVTLKCRLSKSASVTWTKNGLLLEEREHAVLQTEDTSHQLHIPKVRLEDAGTYAVHIGEISSSCTLTVKENTRKPEDTESSRSKSFKHWASHSSFGTNKNMKSTNMKESALQETSEKEQRDINSPGFGGNTAKTPERFSLVRMGGMLILSSSNQEIWLNELEKYSHVSLQDDLILADGIVYQISEKENELCLVLIPTATDVIQKH